VRAWIAHYPIRCVFVSMFAGQCIMTLMMAMTSLALAHHGHALSMISLAVAIHVIGMFGLSLPLGRLCDRFGRRNLMLVGASISGFGSCLIGLLGDYWLVTLGTFLVGLGWSCTNVASSALIADMVPPAERGRAIGTNDSFSGAGSILLPLLGGPLVEAFGLQSLAVIGVGLVSIPFLMLLRLRETSPGHFAE
jgi:MFS family permease